MTPPTVSASKHEPNSCKFARVSPAVVQQPDPRTGISSDRNVHTDALCYKRPHQSVRLCDTSPNCLSQHRHTNSSWSQAQSLMFAFLCGLLFFCQSVQANVHGSSIFDRELVYDRRPMPKPRMGIYARQDDSSSSSATTTTGSSGILAPSSTSSVSESIQVATPVSTSLPRPFDTSIGNNFTESSCPQFFNNFLSNSTFQECLPFSMLLQVSINPKGNHHFQTAGLNLTRHTDIQLFLRSDEIATISHSYNRRNLSPSFLFNLQHRNVFSRHRTFHNRLQKRSFSRKSCRNPSIQRPRRIRHPLRCILSYLLDNRKLLLRRCCL
jgi:hypothetical protein